MRKTLLLLCLLAVSACGGSPSGPTPAPTQAPTPAQARITMSVSPTPVVAVKSSKCPNNDYAAIWTTTVTETAGLDGNINLVNVTLRNPLGFELFTLTYDPNDVIDWAGTNHIAARGQLVLRDMGVCYNASQQNRQARVVQVVNVIDAKGNHVNASTEFDIL